MEQYEKTIAFGSVLLGLGGGGMSAYGSALFPNYAALVFYGGLVLVSVVMVSYGLLHRELMPEGGDDR